MRSSCRRSTEKTVTLGTFWGGGDRFWWNRGGKEKTNVAKKGAIKKGGNRIARRKSYHECAKRRKGPGKEKDSPWKEQGNCGGARMGKGVIWRRKKKGGPDDDLSSGK